MLYFKGSRSCGHVNVLYSFSIHSILLTMNSGKSNGDIGKTSVTQPKTSTPKLSTKARWSASLGQSKQSKLDQSEQPNAEAASQSQSLSQSQINKALSTPLPSSVK